MTKALLAWIFPLLVAGAAAASEPVVSPGSVARIDGDSIYLSFGAVTWRGDVRRFTVATPTGEIEVEGGDFRIETQPDIAIIVSPVTLEATVRHEGETVTVMPNQILSLTPGAVGSKRLTTILDR